MIFRGIGNGSFQLTANYTSGLLFPYDVQVADFSGDSKLDLVVCSFDNNSLRIFLGTGAGNFTQAFSSNLCDRWRWSDFRRCW